ncbi:MAG: response regulator [Bacteroidetes bacterium]|nr:response regulator [Bacteroidota bacterium]
MQRKLKRVLLVDDDANHIQERLIKKHGFAENIDKVWNGIEALEYLNRCVAQHDPLPEIIFLDLNMPKMDGWAFLEKYSQLGVEVKKKIELIILTSSINPDDAERASRNPEVKGYKNKFLDKQQLEEILKLMPT